MGVYVVTGGSGGIGGKTVEILRSQGHETINVDLKGGDINANIATKEGRQDVIDKIYERPRGDRRPDLRGRRRWYLRRYEADVLAELFRRHRSGLRYL